MAQTVHEVMTDVPVALPADANLVEAARTMADFDIGDVVVLEGAQLRGILTDRDIVVRAIAQGRPPEATAVGEVCSGELVTVTPEQPVEEAVRLMRRHALRRLPVVEEGRTVGMVSIGDLALERDPDSALADISAAEPNR
jgi:CBS domain-containing protein